jgi:hypothetical protein
MSKFPQSNLPPKSQPWARDIEKAISTTQNNVRKNSLNTANNLKQINSSMNLLQSQQDILASNQDTLADNQATLADNQATLTAQQAYLGTFLTYTSSTGATVDNYTLNSWSVVTSLSVTFTLTRTSTVLISGVLRGDNYGTRTGLNSSSGAFWRCALSVGGSTYQTENGSRTSIPNNPQPYSAQLSVTSRASNVVTLAAGTYTVTATWSVYHYASTGYVRAWDRILSASIIG